MNSDVKVYPVPASYDLIIESTGSKILDKVELFDLSGKLIISEDLDSKIKLDISNINKSVYILKIYSKDIFIQKKIIVK